MHEITEDISTFDVTDTSLFYVEKNLPVIQSVYQSHVNVTFSSKVHPQAMAVDFLTKKFYMVDQIAKTVDVMDFDGKHFGILLSDLHDPHDIVLDIEQGFMFILQFMKSVTLTDNKLCSSCRPRFPILFKIFRFSEQIWTALIFKK